MAKLTEIVSIKLNKKQKNALINKSEDNGLSLSSFIRSSLIKNELNGLIKEGVRSDVTEVNGLLDN